MTSVGVTFDLHIKDKFLGHITRLWEQNEHCGNSGCGRLTHVLTGESSSVISAECSNKTAQFMACSSGTSPEFVLSCFLNKRLTFDLVRLSALMAELRDWMSNVLYKTKSVL